MITTLLTVPLFHFIISIILTGTGISTILAKKINIKDFPSSGAILLTIAIGILYNTIQFLLIVIINYKVAINQTSMTLAKYIFDVVFIVIIAGSCKKIYFDTLKKSLAIFKQIDNVLILTISIALGVIAILNFPHVHDSGQLIATGKMMAGTKNFFISKRYALGFSSLIYFPAQLIRWIPIGTLASGFKLPLMMLAGLMSIYASDRLDTFNRPISKFLYFTIVLTGIFGLYGIMEMGKDSIWGMMYGLIYIISLIEIKPGRNYTASALYFLCAGLLGVMAFPFLCIITAIYTVAKCAPDRIVSSKILFWTLIVVGTVICAIIMPVRLPIVTFSSPASSVLAVQYRMPLDGTTSFYSYFFRYPHDIYKNSAVIIIIGFVAILLVPLIKKYRADRAIMSAALFPTTAAAFFLLLTLPARNWTPIIPGEKIPFTPFTPFDIWNMIKDVPQWMLQAIAGLFCIILVSEAVQKNNFKPLVQKAMHIALGVVLAGCALAANGTVIRSFTSPAYFLSYGGNKNRDLAEVYDSILANRDIRNYYLEEPMDSFPETSQIYFCLMHYNTDITLIGLQHIDNKMQAITENMPALVISTKKLILDLARYHHEKNIKSYIYELTDFNTTCDGIFIISDKPGTFHAYNSSGKARLMNITELTD